MPLYEYIGPNGEIVTLHRPVAERDIPGYKRQVVPFRQTVLLGRTPDPDAIEQKVIKGYRHLEDTGQFRTSSYKAETIKSVWAR